MGKSTDSTRRRVVAETMWMHIRNLCAPAELGDQVLDPARRVRPAFPAEDGVTDVQRQTPALVALPTTPIQPERA